MEYVLAINENEEGYYAEIREENLNGNIIQTFSLPLSDEDYPETPTLVSDWTDEFEAEIRAIHNIDLNRLFIRKVQCEEVKAEEYSLFIENNDNEGETWLVFCKLSIEQREAIEKLLDSLDPDGWEAESFTLDTEKFSEERVESALTNNEFLEEGYYPKFQKGTFKLDIENLNIDDFYKLGAFELEK